MFCNFIAWKSISSIIDKKFIIEDTSKSTSEKFETSKYAKKSSLNWPYYKTSYCHDVCYAIYVSEKKISKNVFRNVFCFVLPQRLARKRCSNFCFWLESYFLCQIFDSKTFFVDKYFVEHFLVWNFFLLTFVSNYWNEFLPKMSKFLPKIISKLLSNINCSKLRPKYLPKIMQNNFR